MDPIKPPPFPEKLPFRPYRTPTSTQQSLRVKDIFQRVGPIVNPQRAQVRDLDKSRFRDWKSQGTPDLSYNKLVIDASLIDHPDADKLAKTREKCLEEYKQANRAFEQSVCDAAGSYITEHGHPLLEFAQNFSGRYLDLYRIYVKYEIQQNIPMLSGGVGYLKNLGFSTSDVLKMQPGCQLLMDSLERYLNYLNSNSKYLTVNEKGATVLNDKGKLLYAEFVEIILSPERRNEFLQNLGSLQKISEELKLVRTLVSDFNKVSDVDLIDAITTKLSKEDKPSILLKLNEIANLKPNFSAKEDERLLMEIRHRVADGDNPAIGLGAIGLNPLAYFNAIAKGETDNPKAQFREQLYFVYKSSRFTNEMMTNPLLVDFMNKTLDEEGKGWQLNKELIGALNEREPKDKPPLFRYGPQASLTALLREQKKTQDLKSAFQRGTLLELTSPPKNDPENLKKSFRINLSSREIFFKTGELRRDQVDPNKIIEIESGGDLFQVLGEEQIAQRGVSNMTKEWALSIARIVKESNIGMVAGISGTLDQFLSMGGVLGFTSREEMETIKLAMLSFMLTDTSHSVFEIMQSSKTYGMEYVPGPGSEKYIYPPGGQEFIALLEKEQVRRGTHLPSYFLSAEHVKEVYDQL